MSLSSSKQMERVNALLNHPTYQGWIIANNQAEQGRDFCRHGVEHAVDVARIAYISNLEENMGIRKEVIYAAALLHDIGKCRQYEEGIPHEEASAQIAEVILGELPEHFFSRKESGEIVQAILGHRRERNGMGKLERLLYASDKRSRNCFSCGSEAECSWSAEKKNLEIAV